MKIHCYECKTGRPKPNSKYRCIVEGWDKQKEVNATDSCEKGEPNYGENEPRKGQAWRA